MSWWRVILYKIFFIIEDIAGYIGNRFFSSSDIMAIAYVIFILLFLIFLAYVSFGLAILSLNKLISYLPKIFATILILGIPTVVVIFLFGEINMSFVIKGVLALIIIKVSFKHLVNRDDIKREKKRKRMKIIDLNMLEKLDGLLFVNHISFELTELGIENKVVQPPGSDIPEAIDALSGKYYILFDKSNDEDGINGYIIQEIHKEMTNNESKIVFINYGTYDNATVKIAERLNVELININDIKKWDNAKYRRKHNHIKEGFYKEAQEKILKKLVQDGGVESK